MATRASGSSTQAAEVLLKKQQKNFQQDRSIVSKAYPYVSQEEYLHAWLLANTRSFYRLALLPVADLFNHADVGCETLFSPQRYIFTAGRVYRASEEVHVCYGGHSNDFLLTEYGFLLTENRWDAVCLDDVVLPNLNQEQKYTLKKREFLGQYMLDPEGVGCFRTQVALRMLGCAHDQWRQFADAEVDDRASQREANVLLMQFLNTFTKMIQQTLEDIKNVNIGQTNQPGLLTLRWKQIENTAKQSIKRLGG